MRPPKVVTPLAGLRRRAAQVELIYGDGSDLTRAAVAARSADLVIVVAGHTQMQGSKSGAYWISS